MTCLALGLDPTWGRREPDATLSERQEEELEAFF